MSQSTDLSIFEIYKNKADKAREEAHNRTLEVWQKDSRIKEIDDELSGIGMAVFSASLIGDDEKREAEYRRLENRLEMFKAEKIDRLTALGYAADYTDIKYECEKCSDTGYVGIKMCDCLKNTIAERNYKASGIGKHLENQTFENFSFSYYEGEEKEKMKSIYEKAKAYAKNFDINTSDSLLFVGGTGLGKTHLSSAIAKTVIKKGFSVCYDSAQNILSAFEKDRFLREGETSKSEKYINCDLLIIDDLGAELQTKTTASHFYTLINTRLISSKPVIISTNLEAGQLTAQYEKRIVSRLFGEYTVFHFKGKDIRLIKVRTKGENNETKTL